MRLLIKGARVIDPAQGLDDGLDILLQNGKIVRIAPDIAPDNDDMRILSAENKIAAPGLIDMHTHLREPGREDKETILTGAKAAINGGFTSIACMANTAPVNDNQAVTDFILNQAQKAGLCRVYPIGSITKKLAGNILSEMAELKDAGVIAVSDDGFTIANADVMRRALEYASMLNLPVICHCEDAALSKDGVMHEGLMSTMLGLKCIPAQAEEIIVARDIALAELTGARIHIAHVSTAGSVALIRDAKLRGIQVTAEVTPHHFSLTDEAVSNFDTNTKVNPPLRTKSDVSALIEGLADGAIDVIASDHAPHTTAEKELEYNYAPFGMIGLETSLALTLTKLVHSGTLSLKSAIAKLTINPARILGLDKGTLKIGADADITIIDINKRITVDVACFRSKGKNSPFNKWEVQGIPVYTIVGGKIHPSGEIGTSNVLSF